MESRRSDDFLGFSIDHDKRSSGFQSAFEEDFEYFFLVAIALRMLFPDQRIRCDCKQVIPIFGPERAKLDQFAFQMRLKIKMIPDHECTLTMNRANEHESLAAIVVAAVRVRRRGDLFRSHHMIPPTKSPKRRAPETYNTGHQLEIA